MTPAILAVGATLAVLAVPDRAPGTGPEGAGGAATTPAILEALWAEFADAHDPNASGVDEFERWFLGDEGIRSATSLDGAGEWSSRVEGEGFVVRLSHPDDLGRDEGAWSLDVGPAPWSGRSLTIACRDLSCVLCHVTVQRGDAAERPAIASRRRFEEPVGSRLELDAALQQLPDDWLPDLERWLREPRRGEFRTDHGLGVSPGARIDASDLELQRLEPLAIQGASSAHVVAVGTASSPVRVRGDVAIRGDLLLSGVVAGDGQVVVRGNVVLLGDVVHVGDGSLRIGATGSILVGDPARPRAGDLSPVTGGPDGSFSFTLEVLARINEVRSERPGDELLSWSDSTPAPVLRSSRATGGWSDPALTLVAPTADRPVSAVAPSWVDLAALDPVALAWCPPGDDPGGRAEPQRIDAVLVAQRAIVVVAGKSGPARAGGATRELELHGALVADHAAVHAPSGFRVTDDPRAREAQDFRRRSGLRHRIRRADAGPLRPAPASRLPRSEPAPDPDAR